MPCYNAGKTLARLLDALSDQTLAADRYELIVVDDGSTDNSVAIACSRPNVQLIRQQTSGPGIARNRGTEAAIGEIVLYLDVDLIVCRELLEQHLRFHRLHPDIAALGGVVAPGRKLPPLAWVTADHLSSWFNAHPGINYLIDPEYVPSLNFSIKREIVFIQHQLRWYDGLKHTGEDVIFCYQLRAAGLKLAINPNIIVHHYDRESLIGYCRHMYSWGKHAPFVRGRLAEAKYGFLFPIHPIWLFLTLPLIICGYTLFLWNCWRGSRTLQATLNLPLIFFGRFPYAIGVAVGTWLRYREIGPSR